MIGNRVITSLKFPAGILVGILLFSGSAMAFNNYVSDNTPANGYLLCANNKTKVVTFPNKSTCPAGTKALDLGAVTGVEGPEGPVGPEGPPGANGKDALQKSGYLVTLTPQDVVASVASKSDRTLISKSGFEPGYYNLFGEISFLFQNYTMQVVLCIVKTTGSSYAYSGFPSHEVANTWTGHTSQFLGSISISSQTDAVSISCTFSGNTKASWGYLSLTPIGRPSLLTSDPVASINPAAAPAAPAAPASPASPVVTTLSIFGRAFQDTTSTWYIPITNSASEKVPSYSTVQIKTDSSDWTDVGTSQKCGTSGCGAIVSGYTNVCPQFRLIARSGSTITTIWTKGPSSGGTC